MVKRTYIPTVPLAMIVSFLITLAQPIYQRFRAYLGLYRECHPNLDRFFQEVMTRGTLTQLPNP